MRCGPSCNGARRSTGGFRSKASSTSGAGRFVGIIGEPIDPAGFDDPATLTRHLVAVQAPVFLQEAEQVHTHAIDVWDDAVARLTRPKVGR